MLEAHTPVLRLYRNDTIGNAKCDVVHKMLQYVCINDHTLSLRGRPSSSPMFASTSGKHQPSQELPSLPARFGFIEASLIFLLKSFLAS